MVRLPPDVDMRRLAAEQERLARRVERRDRFGGLRRLRLVAGVDVAYAGRRAVGAAVVLDRATGERVAEATAVRPESFPYVPGFLSFRELPVAEAALARLDVAPQLIMVDGAGVLHPRGLGFASHLGVRLDVPTVGVAKSLLCGDVVGTPRPGRPAPIRWQGRIGGYALRTGARARRPLYVSTGHRVAPATAARLVAELATVRLPEPTRQADELAARVKAGAHREPRR